jgi:hypothetical protein
VTAWKVETNTVRESDPAFTPTQLCRMRVVTQFCEAILLDNLGRVTLTEPAKVQVSVSTAEPILVLTMIVEGSCLYKCPRIKKLASSLRRGPVVECEAYPSLAR